MDDLERQYLLTAYDLAMKDPRRTFHEDEIADHMELDYGPNSDEDLIANITSDLYERATSRSTWRTTAWVAWR